MRYAEICIYGLDFRNQEVMIQDRVILTDHAEGLGKDREALLQLPEIIKKTRIEKLVKWSFVHPDAHKATPSPETYLTHGEYIAWCEGLERERKRG